MRLLLPAVALILAGLAAWYETGARREEQRRSDEEAAARAANPGEAASRTQFGDVAARAIAHAAGGTGGGTGAGANPEVSTAPARPAPEPPDDEPEGVLRIYGVVYDLRTALPVSNARVVLSKEGKPAGAATTDLEGHYRLDTARDDFTVGVDAPGYRWALEDTDPPARRLPAAERERRAAKALQASEAPTIVLTYGPADRRVKLDLPLVPEPAPAKPSR